jgi:DNA-directed RNA polymerase specialized sigma24 family protein
MLNWLYAPPSLDYHGSSAALSQLRPVSAPPLGEAEWARALAFLRARLRKLLDRFDDSAVEDATQEAAIRLLRVVRREQVRNTDALMNVICRKIAIDTMRWHKRRQATFEPMSESVEYGFTLPVDPLARIEFAVLEFFRGRQAACYELAVAYFNDRDWEHVAGSLGKSHAAVRKQWSRCLGQLRSVAMRSPDLLFAWVTK